MPLKAEQVIEQHGRQFVTFAGLLAVAHDLGLKRVTTKLVQIPNKENGEVAIVWAEVEVTAGVFSGIGDASPGNVGRQIIPHIIRMGETRAVARALRLATNTAETAIEELTERDEEPVPARRPQATRAPQDDPDGVRELAAASSRVSSNVPRHLSVVPPVAADPMANWTLPEWQKRYGEWVTRAQEVQEDFIPPAELANATIPEVQASIVELKERVVDAEHRRTDQRRPVGPENEPPPVKWPPVQDGVQTAAPSRAPASPKQLQTVQRMARAAGRAINTDGMTRAQASELISSMIGEMDQQRAQVQP